MIHGSSFYIHMHRNLCKVYFCSQGVGVKYCVIGVYGVSTFDDYQAVYYRHVDGFAEAKRREISERLYNALPLK